MSRLIINFLGWIAVAIMIVMALSLRFPADAGECASPARHVAKITVNGGTIDGETFGATGSAVLTRAGAYTAAHNVEGPLVAATIGRSPVRDVTVVAADVALIPAITGPMHGMSRVVAGERVVVAGFPRGEYREGTGVAEIYLGQLRVDVPGFDLGISGGGVFSCDGTRLLGVITSIPVDRSGVVAYPAWQYPYQYRIDQEILEWK